MALGLLFGVHYWVPTISCGGQLTSEQFGMGHFCARDSFSISETPNCPNTKFAGKHSDS